jgi:S1-C subfamily serine protease
MFGKLRYWSFAAFLAAGVMAAVSALVAQGPPPPPDGRGPGEPRELSFLDGRGSRLGVMVQDVDGTDKTGGVRVDSVSPGSPAEKAGLTAGDIVVEYDGERVRSARQFTRLVQETPEGRQVPLAIVRDGKRQSLTAAPEARAFAWDLRIDGDRIRREVERGMRSFERDGPAMRFNFDRDFGGMFVPSSRRRLGVSVDSLSDQLAQYFGASGGGALVTSVEKDSAADQAGLKAGDVITSINGEPVRDAGQVGDKVREVDEGELTIGYLRDKKPGTTRATIAARPSTGSAPARPRRPVRPAAFTTAI